MAREAQQALEHLRKKHDAQTLENLDYEVEVLSEEGHGAPDPLKRRLERMADLAHYSDELRDLADNETFSHGALLVAATVLSDPGYRFEEDEIFQEAHRLTVRSRNPGVSNDEISFSETGSRCVEERENKRTGTTLPIQSEVSPRTQPD